MKKPIHIALSPNSTLSDVGYCLRKLFLPWNYLSFKSGRSIGRFEDDIKNYFNVPHAYAVNSGREALYIILKSLNVDKGSEVVLQSFTCMVVVNSILWNQLTPKYVDIDDRYNMSVSALKKAITQKTKVVIVQHTFGIPSAMKEIREICDTNDIILIEDCAHALGSRYKGKKVGTLADVGFYSTGRSKVVSSVSGGVIVTKNDDIARVIERTLKECRYPSIGTIIQNLLHPPIMTLAKYLYKIGPLGKLLIVVSQKLQLLNKEVQRSEKKSIKASSFPRKMPNVIAGLARKQFKKLDAWNNKRRKISTTYFASLKNRTDLMLIDPSKEKGAIFLRYPVLCKSKKQRDALLSKARKKGIMLGDWYSSPIAPPDSHMKKAGYKAGMNKTTERYTDRVINLPTYHSLTKKDIQKVLELFSQ